MQSHADILIADIASLAAIASVALCGPAATAAAVATVVTGRKKPMTTKRALLVSTAAAAVVGGGAATGLWILRGTIEEISALLFAVPGGFIVALLGAIPGGLVAAFVMRRLARRAEDSERAAAAAPVKAPIAPSPESVIATTGPSPVDHPPIDT